MPDYSSDTIIRLSKAFGYDVQTLGGCHGMSLTSAEKFLTGEAHRIGFSNRLKFLVHYEEKNPEGFAKLAQEAKVVEQKAERALPLTAEEKEILEIARFAKAFALQMQPYKFKAYFARPLSQAKLIELSHYVQSKKLAEQKRLAEAYGFSGIYSRAMLDRVCDILTKQKSLQPLLCDFVMLLSNRCHTVAVGYEHTRNC